MSNVLLIIIAVIVAIGTFPLTVFFTVKLCNGFHWSYVFLSITHFISIIGLVFSIINNKPSTGDGTPGVVFAFLFVFLFVHTFFTSVSWLLYFIAINDIKLFSVFKWGVLFGCLLFLLFVLLPFFHDQVFDTFILKRKYETNLVNKKSKKVFIGKYSINVPINFTSKFEDNQLLIGCDINVVELQNEQINYFLMSKTGRLKPRLSGSQSETLKKGELKTKIFHERRAIGIFKNQNLVLGLYNEINSIEKLDLLTYHEMFKSIVNNIKDENEFLEKANKDLFYLPSGKVLDISNFEDVNQSRASVFFSFKPEGSNDISLRASTYNEALNNLNYYYKENEQFLQRPLLLSWFKHIYQKWSKWFHRDYSYSIDTNHLIRLRKRVLNNIVGKEMIYDFYLGKEFLWIGQDIKTKQIFYISMVTSHRFDITWAEIIEIWDSILNSFEI